MRLENRRRLFAWTSITLVVLAAMAYANRTKLPAYPNAFPNTLSGQCDGCRPEPGALLLASAQRLDYMDPVSGLLMPVLELGHSSLRIGSWYLLALETGRRTIVAEATNAHGAVCDEHADALYFGLSAMTLPERTDLYRVPLGVRARRERVAKGVNFSTGIWIPLPAGRSPLRRGT
jgi:hypothetical protein